MLTYYFLSAAESSMEVQFFTLDSPFHKYYNKVKLGIKPDQWKKFSTLSSPEDRIQFCLNLPGIHDVKVTAHKSIKNLEKAMEYKVRFDKTKDYQKVLNNPISGKGQRSF